VPVKAASARDIRRRIMGVLNLLRALRTGISTLDANASYS
jgi:hypothetical protein